MITKTFILPVHHGHNTGSKANTTNKAFDQGVSHMESQTFNFAIHRFEVRTVSDGRKYPSYHLIHTVVIPQK